MCLFYVYPVHLLLVHYFKKELIHSEKVWTSSVERCSSFRKKNLRVINDSKCQANQHDLMSKSLPLQRLPLQTFNRKLQARERKKQRVLFVSCLLCWVCLIGFKQFVWIYSPFLTLLLVSCNKYVTCVYTLCQNIKISWRHDKRRFFNEWMSIVILVIISLILNPLTCFPLGIGTPAQSPICTQPNLSIDNTLLCSSHLCMCTKICCGK